ncbi:MAG TPA: hypothetical protein VF753_14780 [Terriglobales bacterium]
MSVATLQTVVLNAWKNFGRRRHPSDGWNSTFEQTERALNQDGVKVKDDRASDQRTLFAYADEQLRGLVRQTFLAGWPKPLRQIIFVGADEGMAISELCVRVATVLAEEVRADVCLVGSGETDLIHEGVAPRSQFQRAGFRRSSGQISANLWMVPAAALWHPGPEISESFCRQLEALNREFEFSVIEGPTVHTHPSALSLGKCCDGLVLALEAGLTRKAAAQKAKEAVVTAGANLLGTVLCNRSFPIPDSIYRRV